MQNNNPFQSFETTRLSERTSAALRHRAERGIHPCGPAPYGFRRDRHAPGELVIHEAEAEVIKLAFELYSATSMLADRAAFTASAIRYRDVQVPKESITPRLVARVLRSPAVAGLVRVPGTDEMVEAAFPAIVGRRRFEHVAEMLGG